MINNSSTAGLPQLSIPPVTAEVGSSATLECQILSNPEVTNTTWFYEEDGLRRSIATGGRFIVSASTLTIVNVQESDTGYYVCSAQNVFGTNSSYGRLIIGSKEVGVVNCVGGWC